MIITKIKDNKYLFYTISVEFTEKISKDFVGKMESEENA